MKQSYFRVVGEEPILPTHHRSVFINTTHVSAIVDGDRCVTIHLGAASITLSSLNPIRHARDLISAITNNDEIADTIFFAVERGWDEQRAFPTSVQGA
jgi:uncharacterized Rossmann fold enzyme